MNEWLEACLSFFRERELDAYLVGGTVRDMILRRPHIDLDFVVARDALPVARELADVLGGAFFPLDPARATGRVVMPDRSLVDVASMRGATLADDLAVRDFTMNAMAAPVSDVLTFIDPFRGAADLRAKLVRVVTDQSFVIDPVRMLRALRQSLELDFAIEAGTAVLMRRDRELLGRASGERVRDELAKMLQAPEYARYLTLLVGFEYLGLVLPHAKLNGQPAAPVAPLEVPGDGGGLAGGKSAAGNAVADILDAYVGEILADNRTRHVTLRLAELYADEAGADADLRRLKFSRHEIEFVRALVRHRDAFTRLPAVLKPLDVHRFFRDTSGVAIGLIILAVRSRASGLEQAGDLQHASQLLDFYMRRPDVIAPHPIVNGADIAQRFNLRGPQIGEALRSLVEAQVSGHVNDRDQAEQFLRAKLAQNA